MAQLKSYYERITRLLEERDALSADIRDIFLEVKAAGYVPKILRKVIARHRADQSLLAEEDALLETYEAELDPKTRSVVTLAKLGKSAREIEAATGVDQATVARAVPLKVSQRETLTAIDEVSQRETPDEVEGGAPNAVREGGASADVTTASASLSPPPPAVEDDLAFPSFLDRRTAVRTT